MQNYLPSDLWGSNDETISRMTKFDTAENDSEIEFLGMLSRGAGPFNNSFTSFNTSFLDRLPSNAIYGSPHKTQQTSNKGRNDALLLVSQRSTEKANRRVMELEQELVKVQQELSKCQCQGRKVDPTPKRKGILKKRLSTESRQNDAGVVHHQGVAAAAPHSPQQKRRRPPSPAFPSSPHRSSAVVHPRPVNSKWMAHHSASSAVGGGSCAECTKKGQWEVGERIRCLWKGVEYEAKIVEKWKRFGLTRYKIHYVGWNKKMDEEIGEAEAANRFRPWDSSELPPGMFNVEMLCGKRIHKKRVEYLVRWEGYDDKTWEPAYRLETDGCAWAIDEYEKRDG